MTQPDHYLDLTATKEAQLDRLSDQGVATYHDGATRLDLEPAPDALLSPPTVSSRVDRYDDFRQHYRLTGGQVLSATQRALNQAGAQQVQAALAKASQTAFVPTAGEAAAVGQPLEQQAINQAGKLVVLAALEAAQGQSDTTPIS